MATIPTSNRQRIDINNPIITRIQVEGNDTVSFLNGTVAPYQYVRGMSQIMPQTPTYISYRYDSITISQVSGDSFTFTIYAVTDVGGNTFTPLTFQDRADVVQAKTIEIYRLLVTAVFKGCCECGNTEPECSIQYTSGNGSDLGTFLYDISGSVIRVNNFTANNQDFSGFWPIIQDGSWIFVFSKTDPTVYGVYQLSNYSDGGPGIFAQFDAALLAGPGEFPDGTELCLDVTSVGGSLVQGWQDTLDINSTLDKDNTVDGAGFDFVFDNNSSFTINSVGGSIQTSVSGASLISGALSIDVAPGYIDIITPGYGAATTGMVLALDSFGHVEYTLAGTGTISSIGLFMPSAFTVSTPNPLTSNGDFTVTGAGTDLEYINGLGELATLPVYTVENGLHPFGGVPGETPPNPFLFHLGGQLIEDTLIETTEVVSPGVVNEWQLSVRGAGGTDGQNTQFPFGVANLGDGGVATFQDYGSGDRPNPSVEIVGDVDLAQPLLELNMAGSLPTADDTLLRLRYTGDPSLAMMTMDYQFRNNNAVVANSNFIGSRLSTEVLNLIDGDEETRFELQLVEGGTLSNKLELQGFGQLILNEYGTSQFSNGTNNIDNDLEYVLAVDVNGKVFKKLSEGGGTVTEVDATGLLTTSPDPITTTGTVTSEMNSGFLVGRYDAGVGVFQEITIGSGLTLTGDTLSADGGGGPYTVNNGLTEDPANNFQLGGALVKNTIVNGAANAWDLTFDQLNEFYVNGNNKMIITSTNATGDFSKCYVAPPAAQLINNTAGFAASTISAESGVASMEATPIKILLNATEMQLRTPAVVALTAVNGQVLTLIDAATGEAEWQTGGGTTYTVDNGLSPQTLPTANPDNFQLGGPLVLDTTIDGGSTYDLSFTNIQSLIGTATDVYFAGSDGVNTSALGLTLLNAALEFIDGTTGTTSVLELSNAFSRFTHLDGTTSSISAIELTGAELRVQTPLYASKTAGDVLTLVDPTTGEAEWSTPTGGGGGGGGRSYYLNGSVVQGDFAGITDMREMSPVPVIGVGTDFTISSNGYIKSFITDAGDPNKAVIPAGNWNFELWFSASSGGGSPNFYVELYKYDTVALTLTLISSSSTNPEGITNGTAIDLYLTALSVPQTTLALTDRLAVRVFVDNGGGGRTITLHTQGPHLSQIITDFPSGIVSLNGLTAFEQNLAVGTAGTDFAISSSVATHTFNLPTASAANRGALSSADWTRFDSFKTQTIGITVDGSGGVITAGQKGYVRVPYACTITSWSILTGNAGLGATVTFDIWRANNAIPTVATPLVGGGTKPFLTSATQQITSAAPTGWTSVTLAANDILGFNVEPGAAVFSWVNLQLLVTKI
jgi:hypothetical protein